MVISALVFVCPLVVSTARGITRWSADHVLELIELDEVVGLAAKFISDHRRLTADGRNDRDSHPLTLQGIHQRSKVTVAREEHDMVNVRRDLQGVDREFDIHVAFDFAPAHGIGKLFGRLGHHGEAVVVQPVDERFDRRIFVILQEGGVVECAQQLAAPHELLAQEFVVDVEPERLGSRVEVRSVDEEREALVFVEHG